MAAPFDRRNIDWVLACPLRPRSRRGAQELQAAIAALKAERAGILTLEAREPGAVWLGGWDEQALEAQVTWILAHMTEAVDVGGPEAGYREVIGRSTVVDHRRHDRTGGPRQLMLAVEPRGFPKGQSYETHIAVSGHSDETRQTIEAGVVKGLDSGPVAHYPVIAVLVTVLALVLGDPAAEGPVLEEALRVALRDAMWQAAPPPGRADHGAPGDHAGRQARPRHGRPGGPARADDRHRARSGRGHGP